MDSNRIGLTDEEAARRLARDGPNAVPETRRNPAIAFLSKLVGPVPAMLEAALILEIALGKWVDGAIIGTLLLFNAGLSFRQERKSRAALEALQTEMRIDARVLRDGRWSTLDAAALVAGDIVRVRMGDLVPADLRIVEGSVLLDASMLTGESAPLDADAGANAWAGAIVKRGEATAEVATTGVRTKFGRTAELVSSAGARSHLETLMFTIVRYLVVLDGLLVACVLVYALVKHLAIAEVLPFGLILLVASVPVALPATFTLATALASLRLATQGVLVTRLSAIDDAAAMTVLCTDKTGTLTENRLTVAQVKPVPPSTEEEVLSLAALACDASTQDPLDLAILEKAPASGAERERFVPFDPATKRSEAIARRDGRTFRVIKGAPKIVAGLAPAPEGTDADISALASEGRRVIAVASGEGSALRFLGLVAFADPLRSDTRASIDRLRELGVRVVMVTGDGAPTAASVAAAVGLGSKVFDRDAIETHAIDAAAFAGVFPEDKFRLVQVLQRAGAIVGMTGDGVNDAPALKQAEVGIAVATATDVAKRAASLVLTRPGLSAGVRVVEVGREVYQRMLTWTLNKLVKTFEIAFFLTIGLFATGLFITTPRHILLLIFTNDFVTMALASDRVSFSARPDRWEVRGLVVAGAAMAFAWLLFAFAALFVGRDVLHLPLPQLQTLVFLILVFTGQATIYLLRERRHALASRPGTPMIVASVADVAVVSFLAIRGVLVAPLPWTIVLALPPFVAAAALLFDRLKIALLRPLRS